MGVKKINVFALPDKMELCIKICLSSLDVLEMFISGYSSMYNVIMHYLNSFLLPCSIRNVTLASLNHLLKTKIDFLPLFTRFNSLQWSFSMKTITENQLHDFRINSKHSCN